MEDGAVRDLSRDVRRRRRAGARRTQKKVSRSAPRPRRRRWVLAYSRRRANARCPSKRSHRARRAHDVGRGALRQRGAAGPRSDRSAAGSSGPSRAGLGAGDRRIASRRLSALGRSRAAVRADAEPQEEPDRRAPGGRRLSADRQDAREADPVEPRVAALRRRRLGHHRRGRGDHDRRRDRASATKALHLDVRHPPMSAIFASGASASEAITSAGFCHAARLGYSNRAAHASASSKRWARWPFSSCL